MSWWTPCLDREQLPHSFTALCAYPATNVPCPSTTGRASGGEEAASHRGFGGRPTEVAPSARADGSDKNQSVGSAVSRCDPSNSLHPPLPPCPRVVKVYRSLAECRRGYSRVFVTQACHILGRRCLKNPVLACPASGQLLLAACQCPTPVNRRKINSMVPLGAPAGGRGNFPFRRPISPSHLSTVLIYPRLIRPLPMHTSPPRGGAKAVLPNRIYRGIFPTTRR